MTTSLAEQALHCSRSTTLSSGNRVVETDAAAGGGTTRVRATTRSIPARLEPGVLTHELVARCAADPDRPAVPTARWLLAHAYAVLAVHGATSRRRAMLQRIATLAAAYFRLFGPRADWRFAGAEVRLGTGRIDLAWATPAGHLIDELKTSRFAVVADDGEAIEQAVGYALTASRQLAEGFVGVRLLTLAIPANARFVTPSLAIVPLAAMTFANGGTL